jgi:thermitase
MYMKKAIVASLIAIVLVSSFSTIVFAAPVDNLGPVSDFSSQQILVKFKPDVTLPEVAQIHRQLGGQIRETIPGIGVQVVMVPKGQEKAKAKAYSSNARVAYAEPDFVAEAMGNPDDPQFVYQWGMVKIQAPEAWEMTTGSASINIAILDTGVDLDHPDLASKIISNVNFSSSPTVDDVYGHGTHVAGIAAAMTNNGIGVAGLGYSSTIMNVKVLNDDGMGAYSWLASGIIWAVDNGAKIINMSLGGSSSSSTLEDAVNYAWNNGVVVVASAGNSASTAPSYPAYYNNCIAVAATDANDALASFSNYGKWVDVAAPGMTIDSTWNDGGYGCMSGTSMASPHVAGLAALVFATLSDANGNGKLNGEVRRRIESTCDNTGVGGIAGGRINAYLAVQTGTTGGTIEGIVANSGDGMPIAGAMVSDGVRAALTDAAGQYMITGIPAGTCTLTASAEGYSASSQVISVIATQTAVANFALTALAPVPPEPLWVQSIAFGMTGKNLRLNIGVASANGAVAGAQVAVQLTNGAQNWSLRGTTDMGGLVSFTISKPPAGSYVAMVMDVTATGYTWDSTQGATSASYTLKSGGARR